MHKYKTDHMDPILKRNLVLFFALLIGASILVWMAGLLGPVSTALLSAFLIAYLLDPLVSRLEKWRIPRHIASAFVLFVGLLSITIGCIVAIYLISNELRSFTDQIPQYKDLLTEKAKLISNRFEIKFPADWEQATDLALSKSREILPQVANPAGRILSIIFQSTISILNWFILLILVPVIAFYLLVTYDSITKFLYGLVPADLKDSVQEKIGEMDKALAGFFRGQLLVCLILAVLYSIGFVWIELELAVLVGVLGGILFIVPYLGTAVAAVLATLIAFVQFGDFLHPALVIGWLSLVQFVEGYFITPNVLGETVGLHPVVCIIAIVIGGHLFGLAGMLLAIPLTAMGKVLALAVIDVYLASELYKSPPRKEE